MTRIVDVTDSRVWDTLGTMFADVASTFLTVPVAPSDDMSEAPELSIAAGIRLAGAQHEAEIRIVLGTDEKNAESISEALFGTAAPELMAEAFKELANMWMGALKAAFSAEKIKFTGGLPVALAGPRIRGYMSGSLRLEQFVLAGENCSLLVCVGARSNRNSNVNVSSLEEGMVVAKDVCNENGALMISAGTRLSERSVDRLNSLLPLDQTVVITGIKR